MVKDVTSSKKKKERLAVVPDSSEQPELMDADAVISAIRDGAYDGRLADLLQVILERGVASFTEDITNELGKLRGMFGGNLGGNE